MAQRIAKLLDDRRIELGIGSLYLEASELAALTEMLTSIRTGEMVPFYIMRYGFYEGHTDYRTDPLTISFVFGLKPVEEIEAAFPGK